MAKYRRGRINDAVAEELAIAITEVREPKVVMQSVLIFVKKQLALLVEADRILQHIEELPKEQFGVKALNTQLVELEKEISRYCDLKERLYQDMVGGVIALTSPTRGIMISGTLFQSG